VLWAVCLVTRDAEGRVLLAWCAVGCVPGDARCRGQGFVGVVCCGLCAW
jgi:hypothetical protein